jgi:hypothetical protein
MNRLRAILLSGLLLLPLASARAQGTAASPACLSELYKEINLQQRLFRAVIFGEGEPSEQAIGAVLYDSAGNGWTKSGIDDWTSLAPENESKRMTDGQMEDAWERDPVCKDGDPRVAKGCVELPRRGVLETREALTSEIIARGILPAVRAFQCRLASVCEAFRASAKGGEGVISVQAPGCERMVMNAMPKCGIENAERLDASPTICERTIALVLDHELSGIEMVSAYDSYRSYVQIAGIYDAFSKGFGRVMLEPLIAAAKSMSAFGRIPCFLAQCDE